MLGSLEKSTQWYLGYKNIFCWLKPVPCGNVLMWFLKHVLRNAVNTYSSLSGFYLVRNTQELCLSACALPHYLPCACRSGLSVFNEAEVAKLEGHHQHCYPRENFPSDKSLNQQPGSDIQKIHPSYLQTTSLRIFKKERKTIIGQFIQMICVYVWVCLCVHVDSVCTTPGSS